MGKLGSVTEQLFKIIEENIFLSRKGNLKNLQEWKDLQEIVKHNETMNVRTLELEIKLKEIPELKEIFIIIESAWNIADKFTKKVDSGKARSVETYSELKELKEKIEILQEKIK